MPRARVLVVTSLALVACSLAVLVSGCGGGRVTDWQLGGLGKSLSEIQRGARGERQVDLVVRAGFAVPSWARAFTQQTGCTVSTHVAASSGELVDLVGSGDYDGLLAASDVTRRLIEQGEVAPVDFDLVPSYADVDGSLKGRRYDTVDGTGYAVPQGRVPNLELFRTDLLPADLDSWAPMWLPYFRGSRSVYDSPMFIADAALYLASTRPRLRITNPYELDAPQFQAVVGFLRRHRPTPREYWSTATTAKQIESFTSADAVVGTTWPRQVAALGSASPPVPIAAVKPKEGVTGWADMWMVSAHAHHPNCTYLWLDYIVSPEANAKIAERFELAPSNAKACELTTDESFCTTSHADDEQWWNDVHLWTTPEKDCGDARGDTCKTYDDWRDAWAAIRTPR